MSFSYCGAVPSLGLDGRNLPIYTWSGAELLFRYPSVMPIPVPSKLLGRNEFALDYGLSCTVGPV